MQRSLFIQRDITCSREGKQAAPYVQDGRHTFSAGNCNALFVYNLKRPIQEALRNSHNTNSKCRSEKFHTRCERACGSNILIIASPNAEKYKIIKRIVQRRMVWADESFCFRGSDARRSPSGSLSAAISARARPVPQSASMCVSSECLHSSLVVSDLAVVLSQYKQNNDLNGPTLGKPPKKLNHWPGSTGRVSPSSSGSSQEEF